MNPIAIMNWITILVAAMFSVGNIVGLWQAAWSYLWLAAVPPVIGMLVLIFNRGKTPYTG